MLQPPRDVLLAWGQVVYRKSSFWGLKALKPSSVPAVCRTLTVRWSDRTAGLRFLTAQRIWGSTQPGGKPPALNNLCTRRFLWGALCAGRTVRVYNLPAVISKSCTNAAFGAGFSSSTRCAAAANGVLGGNIMGVVLFFFVQWSMYKLKMCCRMQLSSQVWTGELEDKTPFRFQREAGRKCWMPTEFSHFVEKREREREMSWNWACKVNTGWSMDRYMDRCTAGLGQHRWSKVCGDWTVFTLTRWKPNFPEPRFILPVLCLKDRKI